MKIALSWLKRHLKTEASVEEIAETMTKIGLEVEEIDDPRARLAAFTVGHVAHAEQHPNADKLRLCKVQTRDGEKQIVCGAPNAREGIKIAYAPVGSYVPGIDLTLTKAKIRGVESHGMMCSAREMMLGEDHDGIIELPDDAAVGTPITDWIEGLDPVIDFEVTPNRPDTNGVVAVARDLAAAGLGEFISPEIAPLPGALPCPQKIGLHFPSGAEDACPVFAGRIIRGLKNGPSPQWMQDALAAVGLRPINMLVDVTNYISLDRARPLHVYDADKLRGEICARLGKEGERFLALDGKEYAVDETMCVIADEARVLGLGGVMGGEETGCTEETVNVFIESAYFDPVRTRRTGMKTGIISDARYRFERGVDPTSCEEGLEQATAMILEVCGGEPSEIAIAGAPPAAKPPIAFDPALVRKLTGMKVDADECARILEALGFDVERSPEGWRVAAPGFRPDIDGPADLVEEIARIKGFDHLPAEPLARLAPVERPKLTPEQNRVRAARRALAGRGLLEAVTWSFCDREAAALFGGGADALVLDNPISSDLDTMRPSVLPHLLTALQRNADRARKDLALFEVGPAYAGDEPRDQRIVAGGARRSAPPRHWAGAPPAADCFTAKADALCALEAAGAPLASLKTTPDAPSWYHPGRSGALRLGPKLALAYFGEIHPGILKKMDVHGPVYAFEAFLDALPKPRPKATKTRPALNASELLPVSRDFAFVVDKDTPAQDVVNAAMGADKKLIESARIFDAYVGQGVPAGKKSLAIEVVLQPREKTLTDKEIEAVGEKIVAAVRKATGGELRA